MIIQPTEIQTSPAEKVWQAAIEFTNGCKPQNIIPFGSGHINDTYLVTPVSAGEPFILQRINISIFPDVKTLMNNISLATRHLHLKSEEWGYLAVRFLTTPSGKHYTGDDKKGYWRAMSYISNSATFNRLTGEEQAFEAGKALGAFHAMFNDFNAATLTPTLPDFHHLGQRLTAFHTALKDAPAQRIAKAEKLIGWTRENATTLLAIDRLTDNQLIPLRVVHNDPKVNNILFDRQGKALCMIDLDTVMPGYLLHDFGDAIRTSASLAEEDEPDAGKCGINLSLFESYLRGYLDAARPIITPEEADMLALSSLILTFTIGLRFLTDYLAGDVYYKTAYPGHNLVRAKAQFAQATDIRNKLPKMEQIVRRHFS